MIATVFAVKERSNRIVGPRRELPMRCSQLLQGCNHLSAVLGELRSARRRLLTVAQNGREHESADDAYDCCRGLSQRRIEPVGIKWHGRRLQERAPGIAAVYRR